MPTRYGRILPKNQDFYVHAVSRIVDRRFVLGSPEKKAFLQLMRRLAAFSGIDLVTYCLMDNHVHLLCHVPRPPHHVTDKELLDRLHLIYTQRECTAIKQRLQRFKGYASPHAYHGERHRHLRRTHDLGQFMKTLKQQFTRWYNRRHHRSGTLWEARYKSVVVEGAGHPLLAMSTYIDLNPVRAGICSDPKDYRWSGYGEALGGSQIARQGLKTVAQIMGQRTDWRSVHRVYRTWLYGAGEEKGLDEKGEALQPGFSRAETQKVWQAGGHLPAAQLLRCRIRYFTDGVAIGSNTYLDQLARDVPNRLSPKRWRPSTSIKGSEWHDLSVVRNLQVDVVS